MCRWRQISDTYTGCNHAYRHPDQIVHCDDRHCKFSPMHDPNCGPDCKESCWQYRQFPEQITQRFDRKCSACQEVDHQLAQQARRRY